MLKRLIEKTYDALTVDEAAQTEAINVDKGHYLVYVVVVTDESSATGTTIQLQASLDGVNFVDHGSAVTVDGNGTFAVTKNNLPYKFYRLAYTHSSGSYVATTSVLVKGEEA